MSLILFENYAKELIEEINTLKFAKTEGIFSISGNIPIIDDDGNYWHTYQIEIYYKERFPFVFPTVFEVGGAIPRIADWHINVDGSCCLDNEFSQEIKCFQGLSLVNFTKKELIPWLANQSYRRTTGNYINGEQSHGDVGRIDFFMEELDASNLFECINWLVKITTDEVLPRQGMCICNSGKKWRHCHKSKFDRLRLISKPSLIWAIEKFSKYYKAGLPFLVELQRHTKRKLV
jgi:hypothetical protein